MEDNANAETFIQNLGAIDRLKLNLKLSIAHAHVQAAAPRDLSSTYDESIPANERGYRVSGTGRVTITYLVEGRTGLLTIASKGQELLQIVEDDLSLDLDLPPGLPIDLILTQGIGACNLDLTDLTIEELSIGGGVGAIEITLPSRGQPDVLLMGNVGEIAVNVPEDAIELRPKAIRAKTSVGQLLLSLPPSGGYTLEVETSVGGAEIYLPGIVEAQIRQVSGSFLSAVMFSSQRILASEVGWRTNGWSGSESGVSIVVKNHVGGVTIHDLDVQSTSESAPLV
ncbi:MAG: hypothetical protein GYB68_04415 [Chloroflexi bacterium]|nr:hypothetical protein [Chloroflexota bacterium]